MSQTLSQIDSTYINELSKEKSEPDWLKQFRQDSFKIYNDTPIETSPLYNKYTDAKRLKAENVNLSSKTDSQTPSFLNSRIKDVQNNNSIIQIGTNIDIKISDSLKQKGVILTSIKDAISNMPELLKQALDSNDSTEDKFTALNNAAFNTGFFIYVPKNTTLDVPIHILTCMSLDGMSCISKNIIHVQESSNCKIIQELYSPAHGNQQSYLEMLNVNVAQNSHIDLTTLQMMNKNAINFSTRYTSVLQDGTLNWYLGLFGSLLSRYRTIYYLLGSGATVNDSEVIFGDSNQSFDIQTDMNHKSPSTEGRIIEKSILRGKSRSLFKGMIRIDEHATKSNSYLSGRSILLDSGAKSDAIPGLEIFTNDVKATHSASVAQIDEEQIFYLGTRCLDRATAEKTIVEGFLEPLSRKMSYQVRAWIAYLVESKWDNRDLMINDDDEFRKFVEVEETRYDEDMEIEQHYKYR